MNTSIPEPRLSLSRGELFWIFLKAGCAFGGGLSVLGLLQEEFVTRRRLITPQEFVRQFGVSRLVPSGSVTALTIGFGYRAGGILGILLAVAGLVLPGFAATVALTAAYPYLRGGSALRLISAVILPAAVGLVVVAAVNLTRAVIRTRLDVALAAAAFLAAAIFDMNPTLVLVIGGGLGVLVFRPQDGGGA